MRTVNYLPGGEEAAYYQLAPLWKLLYGAHRICSMSAVSFHQRIYGVQLTFSNFIKYSSMLPEIDFSFGTIPPRKVLGLAAVL
jgi:hypothetical protein